MINGIAQPVFTRVADDKARQLAVFRKLLRFTAFISFPAMLGLSLVSKELIIITITEKWLPSADILQLLCIWGAFIPVINLFSNLLISRGHSSIYMWSTISLSLLQIVAVCAIYPYGLEWMLRISSLSISAGCLYGSVCQEGDRIKTARYAERHLSLSLPIHCTRSVNSLCYSAHRNLYLNMAAKSLW